MDSFNKAVDRVEQFLMAILASCSLVVAVAEMFMRYFLAEHLPDWTAEVVVYTITAAVLLSGGSLVSEGRHVNADIFLRMAPAFSQRILEMMFCVVGIIVCLVMFDRGLQIVELSMRLDERSDSSLQFPMYIYYAFVPLSFGLMLLHYFRRLYRYVFHFDAETMIITEIDLENAD